MPIFKIDRVPLSCPVKTVDIIPPGAEENKLAAGQRIFVQDQAGVDIEVVFGEVGLTAANIRELELARGRGGIHMITFENISCDELLDLLAFMPFVPRTMMRKGEQDYVYTETTLRFSQVDPAQSLLVVEWRYVSNGTPLTAGDGKMRIHMPAGGTFVLTNGLGGYSPGLSGGAGEELEIQLRNSTQGRDYFTTTGKFKIDSATGRLEDQSFGTANRSFVKDDIIEVDFDAVPVWTPAADETVCIIQAHLETFGIGAPPE